MEDLQRRSGEKADFIACQAFGKPSYHLVRRHRRCIWITPHEKSASVPRDREYCKGQRKRRGGRRRVISGLRRGRTLFGEIANALEEI